MLGSLPLILCSLHLCFLNTNTSKGVASSSSPSYIIPCSIATHHKDKVKALWMTTTSPSSPSPSPSIALAATSNTSPLPLLHKKSWSEGRRLAVSGEQQMFHPAFLPQRTCHLLSLIPFSGQPMIWQGGVVFTTASGHCLVGLYMHGAFIAHKIEE